jgi:cysteine desulfurase family protein (TIGR01976 family)
MTLNITAVRSRFPALQRDAIFLDNPAGTQVAQPVLDRVNRYLVETNANHGGAFATSQESDAVLDQARSACADFYNASSSNEIVFGPNMTSLTFNLSRSLSHLLTVGDEIVVTRLDHDANITPWTMIAQERDCKIRWVDFDVEDGTLRLDTLEQALIHKPKLVAVGYASNALGTINPVRKITKLAKAAGALVYIDAVQYAPHGPIDVQELDCDFLVSSAYKFFSTHVGILYGRYELLEQLKAYKVRPASDRPPGKFETGTQNHEGIAGVLGGIEYLEWLGETYGDIYVEKYADKFSGRRLRLKQAMAVIRAYEYEISRTLLQVLKEIPGVHTYGLTDPRKIEDRVPTFSIRVAGIDPRSLARELNRENIFVWDGNYYALAVTERLGIENSGGMVRIGPVHYNSLDEIYRFGEVLTKISKKFSR